MCYGPGNNFRTIQIFYMNAWLIPQVIASSTVLFSCILGEALWKLWAMHQDEYATFLVSAWQGAEAYVVFWPMAPHQRRQRAGSFRQEEAAMTLRMRLNVLAAVVSFAFLTAIVAGML